MFRIRSPLLPVAAFASLLALAAPGAVCAQGGGQAAGNGSASGGKPTAAAQGSEGSSPSGAGSQAAEQPARTGAGRQSRGSAASSAFVSDQERKFDQWLSSAREGARMESVRGRLKSAAKAALEAGVPLEAFIARIQEAVAKGASPETVAAAIEADAARWIWLAGLLDGGTWGASAPGFYLAVAAAFRNGLNEAAVIDVVSWARASRSTTEKAGAALTAAAAISAAFGARDARIGAAARVLAASRLKPGDYDDVAALAARAAAAGMGTARFLAALESTIGSGRPLADLEKTLFG